MSGRFAGILIFLAIFLAPGTALGRDWYVSVSGVAGAAGTLPEPTSLSSALSRSATDDVVIMRGGQYNLTFQVFLEREGLVLRNYENEKPVLVLPYDDSNFSCVVWLYQARCELIGLEIVGGYYYGVKVEYPDCAIRNCIIRNTGRDGIKIPPGADRCVIENSEIYDTGKRDPTNAEGIDNVASNGIVVRGCHIHHTATNGIYMKGGAANCVIEGNLVTDTGGIGIMLGQSTDLVFMTSIYECRDSIARNNVVLRTRGSGLAFEAANNCRFYNNTLYDVAREYGGGISVHANEHNTPSKDVYVRNNIVVVKSSRPIVFVHPNGLATTADMTSDNNLYFNSTGVYKFWWEPGGNFWTGLDQWQANTPFDEHSFIADPQFTGVAAP